MKKIIYYISGILLIVLIIIINLSSFQKRKLLKIMNSDYSFIINKPIDYSCLDSTNQHISNSNYILNIISPTCEDFYVNLNKWELIASQNKKLQKKIIFLVIGDEFERLDEIINQNKDFQFYFDYTHNFFKLNPLIPRSQTFLIEDNKILCGSPLDNKMIMNIFIDYIKN